MKTKILFFIALLVGAVSLHAQSAPSTVFAGSTVTFTVTVDGTAPFNFVWQKAPVGSTTFANIAGQTASTYTIASATAADAGNYRVLVSNGGGSTTSDTAILASGTKPTITSFGLKIVPPPAAPAGS